MGDFDGMDALTGDPDTVRSAFEQLGLIVACYSGLDHRVIAANAAFRTLAGRPDVLGRSAAELFPEFAARQLLALTDRAYRTRHAQTAREWRTVTHHPVTGEPRETYLDVVVEPRYDGGRAFAGVTSYGFDVTARVLQRRAEHAEAVAAQRNLQAVDELQQALLPAGLPALPRLDIAARYLTAARRHAAGGDWFDAITLDGGRVALVVGDVVGHGVAASAAMGQLRAVLRQALSTTGSVADAVANVDSFAAQHKPLRAATIAVVVVDQATGDLEYCVCGHPPPLVVGADGTPSFLPGTRNAPLGVGRCHGVDRGSLGDGQLVMLYSDGLIQRPWRALEDGYAELAQVASDAVVTRVRSAGPTESIAAGVCETTVELLTRSGYDDDVTALMAQRLTDPPADLTVSTTAEESGLPGAVGAVRTWLAGLRIQDDTALAMELAIVEAFANAAEHAYRDRDPGRVRITGRLTSDGSVVLEIADDGIWRDPVVGSVRESRGLALMERLVDQVTVTRSTQSGQGTTVTIQHAVMRPAVVAWSIPGATAQARPSDVFATELLPNSDRVTLRVMGAVDLTTADRFVRDLSEAAQAGAAALIVDLSAVTLLSSVGVRALFELVGRLAKLKVPLTLAATAGSPAAVVLGIVGLPFTG